MRVPRVCGDDARRVLTSLTDAEGVSEPEPGTLTLGAPDGGPFVVRVAAALGDAGVPIEEISLRRPSLDDVFLTLTGRAAPDETPEGDPAAAGPQVEAGTR
ncbi:MULTISPECIES: hypothetical protein [unclassified Blastococcus]